VVTIYVFVGSIILIAIVTSLHSSTRNWKSSSPAPRILNLTNWKLTLPVCTYNPPNPDEIKQPMLNRYQSQFFRPNDAGDGVIFCASAGGCPTVGSDYARTELREMADNGTRPASWSCSLGTHRMIIRQAIDHLPTARPAVVAGQIHATSVYGMLIRLDDTRLYVRTADGPMGDLDASYQLGTIFTLKLEVENEQIRVYYNEELKVDFVRNWETCYFKAGVYLQSNRQRWGDSDESYGQVTIYDLEVSHT
jgi:Alginate lyase